MIEELINFSSKNGENTTRSATYRSKLEMYPTRPTEGLEEPIEELKKIFESKNKENINEKNELSEENKQKLFKFEEQLFEKLKPSYDLEVGLYTFYPEYFLTKEGQNNWEEIFGESIEFKDENDIKRYLITNRNRLERAVLEEREIKKSQRKRSVKYANKKPEKLLFDFIVKEGPEIGELPPDSIKGLKYPERISVVADLKGLLTKIEAYLEFKKDLSVKIVEFEKEDNNLKKRLIDSEDDLLENKRQLWRAKMAIAKIYQKKINVLLAELYEYAVALQLIKKEDKLSEEEKSILNYFRGLNRPEKNLSRIDKFKHGTAIEKPAQIGSNLLEYAEELREIYQENEIKKIENPEIFLEGKNGFSVETFEELANKLLIRLELKTTKDTSKIPMEKKADDNKWRITVDDAKTSMGIDRKTKNIILDKKGKSIYSIFCVMMAHEFTHVFQNILKEELKDVLNLKIIAEIGGDRGAIFAEAGAKMMEDKMSQELFGLKNLPHPNYIAAMQARLAGNNYFGCVKAFYDSALEINRYVKTQRINRGDNPEEVMADFMAQNKKNLNDAISRVKRLFRPSVVSLNSKDPYLTSSKETVYLEQLQLVEKLGKNKMEFLTLIGGLNLENLALLTKVGLIDKNILNKLREKTSEIEKMLFTKIKEIYNEFVMEQQKVKIKSI
ncbi:MAG: hypothetical protein ACOZAR_02045 [Patescibacteria group bacterium]